MRMIKCFKIIAIDVAMSDVTETKTWPEKINDIDKEKFMACKLTEIEQIDWQFTDVNYHKVAARFRATLYLMNPATHSLLQFAIRHKQLQA